MSYCSLHLIPCPKPLMPRSLLTTLLLFVLAVLILGPVSGAADQPANNCHGVYRVEKVPSWTPWTQHTAHMVGCIGTCSPGSPCELASTAPSLPVPQVPEVGTVEESYCGCGGSTDEPSCCHAFVKYEWVLDEDGNVTTEVCDWGVHGSCRNADCPVGGHCKAHQVDPEDHLYPIDFESECAGKSSSSGELDQEASVKQSK